MCAGSSHVGLSSEDAATCAGRPVPPGRSRSPATAVPGTAPDVASQNPGPAGPARRRHLGQRRRLRLGLLLRHASSFLLEAARRQVVQGRLFRPALSPADSYTRAQVGIAVLQAVLRRVVERGADRGPPFGRLQRMNISNRGQSRIGFQEVIVGGAYIPVVHLCGTQLVQARGQALDVLAPIVIGVAQHAILRDRAPVR